MIIFLVRTQGIIWNTFVFEMFCLASLHLQSGVGGVSGQALNSTYRFSSAVPLIQVLCEAIFMSYFAKERLLNVFFSFSCFLEKY